MPVSGRITYPYKDGDFTVIGPECFTDDGSVICWKGENYVRQDAVREALDELGVPGPETPAPIGNAVDILTRALAPKEDTHDR